jgi:hypothetical protein
VEATFAMWKENNWQPVFSMQSDKIEREIAKLKIEPLRTQCEVW